MTRQEKWDKRWLRLVLGDISTWSKDRTKVSAVAVDENNHIISIAYNGFPDKFMDLKSRYEDRDFVSHFIQHAEDNIINQCAKRGVSIDNATIYTSHFPCSRCYSRLVSSGIKRIVTIRDDDFEKRWKHPLIDQIQKETGIIIHGYARKELFE